METRPSWHEYFMEMAHLAAKRSTCLRRHVGAVLVKGTHILATGYNGSPADTPHCAELGGCLREKLGIPSGQRHEMCRGAHAEANAIAQAAKHGTSCEGAVIYCVNMPCVQCAKLMINAGITHIYYEEGYADGLGEELMREAGIHIQQV